MTRNHLRPLRHLMLRWVRRRFSEAASSAPWLAQVVEPAVLEDLGEALLDCANGAAWLAVVYSQETPKRLSNNQSFFIKGLLL